LPLPIRDSSTGAATNCRRVLVLFLVSLIVGNACSTRSPAPDVAGEVSEAYAVVIRWFVDSGGADREDSLVYVIPLGEGTTIGLDTQAAVVAATESFADVRFIDDRSEVLVDEGVRDDALLLALGPSVTNGRRATIECAQVESTDEEALWSFELVYRNDTWVLTDDPTRHL
jgi:hypothetical protein